MLKATAVTTTLGAFGTLSTGTAAAAASMDAAFLTDNVDLNVYHHNDQAEYVSSQDTTYHVYQAVDTGGSSTGEEDSDGDAYIVAYDHADGSVTGPVRIGYNPENTGDTHGVPSLTIDGDGYIHVFFGAHSDLFQYGRSENPYDITSWIHPPSGASGSADVDQLPVGTYPNMTYDSNEDAVYVLYRSGGSGGYPSHNHATLGKTTDNGVTWTDINTGVIDLTDSPWDHTDAYVCDLGAWHGRIHMTWMIAESDSHGQPRRHVYHAAYNPSTGNMETMSGTDLGSEVSHSEAENDCKVKDTSDISMDDGGSVGGYNHVYDADSDTAYIPVKYPLDSDTAQTRVLSYTGVSDQSGSWQESVQITTEDNPGSLNVRMQVNDSGQPEITGKDANGNSGLWRKESGSWNFYDYVAGTSEIDNIQRPVQNGSDDFGWYGRSINNDAEGDAWRSVYALGFGQPSGAGATPTRAPKNLRVVSDDGSTATIDWDDGIAGTSGVDTYKVYVDGSHHKDVTTQPPNQPYPRTWTDVNYGGGTADIDVSLVNGNNTESATSNTVTVGSGSTSQSPYNRDSPWPVPGTIQAEDYDEGGQGVAYNDDDSENNGGEYRNDGVDIETTQDSQGSAYNVGYTNPDEWLEYTIDVGSSGTYDLDLRTARNNSGTSPMHVEIDGTDVTGQVDIPSTGGWQTWQTVTVSDISLSAGEHVMRVYFDGDGINYNFAEWTQVSSGQSPYGGTAHAIPGKIEAEDFDTGGEGVAYHDTTDGNEGSSSYRSGTDVDLGTGGSGVNLGWTADGEWLEYTVDVSSAGTYDLDLRVCSNTTGGAGIHFEFDGTDETGIINVPDNDSWSNYQTITETGIDLDAGQQVMRLYIDSASFNLDWMDWKSVGGGSGPTPVTHYTFDESSGASTATDSEGDDDASINSGVTTGVTGEDGTAFDFDGSSSARVVDADADSYINGLSEFAVSCWVQSDSNSNDRGIFDCGNSSSSDSADNDLGMRYDSSGWNSGNTDCIKAIVKYDDNGTAGGAQVETESNVQTTNWQHLVYSWSAGDQIRIYVDGSEVSYGSADTTPSGAVIANQTAFAVGAPVHTNNWDGKIDDVRIYDQALSASEVSDLYNSY